MKELQAEKNKSYHRSRDKSTQTSAAGSCEGLPTKIGCAIILGTEKINEYTMFKILLSTQALCSNASDTTEQSHSKDS
jgi:hypothetical protein